MRTLESKTPTRWPAAVLLAFSALAAAGCCGGKPCPHYRCDLVAAALDVDPFQAGDPEADAILEPGETAAVQPAWRQQTTLVAGPGAGDRCQGTAEESGASVLNGPAGATYTAADRTATYRLTTAPSRCSNCYSVFVSSPATRPVDHWDVELDERLSGTRSGRKTWILHVGRSFFDVPRDDPFYGKIETVFHRGIVEACSPGSFCPGDTLSRAAAAASLARAIAGADANVPDSGAVDGNAYRCGPDGVSLFTDVAATSRNCRYVHAIAARKVSLGCAPSRFCPDGELTRLQMAALVAKAMVQPGGGAAVPAVYGPDPETGRSYASSGAAPSVHFNDVPSTDASCKLTHYLWARGVAEGCGPDRFCADGDVTREEMAKFLVRAFGLKLYGP